MSSRTERLKFPLFEGNVRAIERTIIMKKRKNPWQKLITDTISEENIRTKEELERLQPLVEFVNSFDTPENLKTILNSLKEDYLDDYSDERLRPLKVEFSPYISKKLEEIAKTKGITQREALAELVKEDRETMENGEKKFKKLEERIKSQRRKKPKI